MTRASEPRFGAHWSPDGIDFFLPAPHAGAVWLCLFDGGGTAETERIALQRVDEIWWHRRVSALEPGQLYNYRLDGPLHPDRGEWFDPQNLLVDPGARAVCQVDDVSGLSTSLRSIVVDSRFEWGEDRRPATPWSRTRIYECHVKGLTIAHPGVSPHLQGTYLGLSAPTLIDHYRTLGITAVELLPVQQFISEPHLLARGLTNYFGYNPIAFFAPHASYATADRGQQVAEFKTMVQEFHRAGIEVLLDVVFNHTAEGNHLGQTLSLRGIDNPGFYRLDPDYPKHYIDFSGCGNTVHFGRPLVLDLAIDCLAYWVEEMHVDGFRFDLAPILGRREDAFRPQAPFFQRLQSDPRFAGVKLIAEPWDVGPQGYQLGSFPAGWREWNDRYRDRIRSFWRGDAVSPDQFALAVCGSPDVFPSPARQPDASVNFIAAHDGFTLRDLVSYEAKHNWANGEENRDGHNHNLSCNWGIEGPTNDERINALRLDMQRNFLATLALSLGVPMLGHGDELGRTQSGNNNAYCQDNETTWVDWNLSEDQHRLFSFTTAAFQLRARMEALLADSDTASSPPRWLSAHAHEMTQAEWSSLQARPLGWLIEGKAEALLAVFNRDSRGHLFELPSLEHLGKRKLILSSAQDGQRALRGHAVRLPARSLTVIEYGP